MTGTREAEPGSAAALGHLRKYSRDALYGSALLAVVFPVLSLINGLDADTEALPLIVLCVCWLVFLALFLPGAFGLLRDPWRVRPLHSALPLLALGILIAVLAMAWLKSGIMWSVLTGLAVAELLLNRPNRYFWPVAAMTGAGAGVVMLWLVGTSDVHWLVRDGVLSGVIVATTCYLHETTARLWRSSLDLDNARHEAAELAATRERLRLSQDLHDILGHALEVVSLKSELAARLSTVDPERAHAEMVEVQELARGALQDVRSLAHAQRPTDLLTELTGARKLLASAEISCKVAARPEELPAVQRELLGWVLREAVTNLLRHADARQCWITLAAQEESVVLTIGNDGALESGEWGSGLSGLAERIRGGGGEFTAVSRDGEFVVTASLPRLEVSA